MCANNGRDIDTHGPAAAIAAITAIANSSNIAAISHGQYTRTHTDTIAIAERDNTGHVINTVYRCK